MANDLIPTDQAPSSQQRTQILSALSPGLSSLLYRETSDSEAVDGIARHMADEARRVLPALRQQATDPAGHEGIRDVIGQSFARYPQPERGPGEWAMWWRDYYEALADLPRAAIEAGMRAWKAIPTAENPEAKFLPPPPDLRRLALSQPNRDANAHSRAAMAVKRADETATQAKRAEAVPKTPDGRAAVANMLADYLGKVTTKDPPPPFKPTRVKVDSHGLTAEMRAQMASQERRDRGGR